MPLNILDYDPYLEPFKEDLSLRLFEFARTKKRLLGTDGSLVDFANGYKYFGFQQESKHWTFREWAPNAKRAWLVGDFNNWENNFELKQAYGGTWEISIPGMLPVGSKVKVKLLLPSGETVYRVPSYIMFAIPNERHELDGVIVQPKYDWKNKAPQLKEAPLIYEAHIGISTEEYKINSYKEFTRDVLPRIKKAGYNTIQLMAIMEHPLYASFGYQVSNFFAISSRFGQPEDLMELIDQAHGIGLRVLLDVVHSHAVKNIEDGLNYFDGTENQYFHEGERGNHPAWKTKLFNYGKDEVIHFLLSNLKFWLDTYHFDGFRFDGVTSMLYHDHGLGTAFTDYSKYFSLNTDIEAVTYLMLANELTHLFNPSATTIAEDMSAMPGMALPISSGGIGFDYRLSMGIPDFWIKQLKEKTDNSLDLLSLWWELTTRRPGEKNIGYSESHDQALVGDKTIMMWLADEEIYWKMDLNNQSLKIDRAIALHKLIRLITFSLAGEGYLNFMGNEFGHPEWLDFPRQENHDDFQHARRQWSLADNKDLRFQYLLAFDQAMINLERHYKFLESPEPVQQLWIKNSDKLLAYQKGQLLFVFNFHPSYEQELQLQFPEKPELIFDSDDQKFGGFGPRSSFGWSKGHLNLILEPRTAMVFQIKE
ncbi:14-alpha-glucan (glycogen) branching enzyme GH-13-type [Lactococcus lactis subsp. lactis]|uniref:alpha-amylase family glycosyl hydrolase n=1 Tax=Lactococcus lactis TaxID=1358 RepID=UPI00071E22D0|nr:alpha-amylase family glycosyl hydrolase [Lactococcus lactis]ARE09951.1 alpha-amylase family glycosyl hydrolase [Lactococcus lactis subsp. lactis]KSU32192.1 14-alpha-glucan (glycogen) branching enzyme GH-13-type [Lactococcus lactis subsp. lactis]UPG98001.1 alpha-amylase family glycosyl hydrolase [Lactococcus lactis]URL09002.1 alpha amylase C-terminal domain-containing protein [Lactococcus lactis subsp. lactis]GEB07839.1 1,4-alpha-glucan branching enzyme [Lactococcus lactis subsp. lactis]